MDTIARRLGVSKTTVHYAIRNTGRLSESTRKRVLKMVEAVGYRPDGLARSFRRRRTDTLGIVMVTLRSSMHARTLEGLESVARAQKYAMLVVCSHASPEAERELVEVLLEKGVDGVVVTPTDPVQNREYYRGLVERGVRLVLVDREIPGLNVDSVSTDNEQGGFLEAEHLVSLGRKRFVYLATRPPQHRSTAVRARLRGVERVLKEARLRPATVLTVDTPDWAGHERCGYDVMREYVKEHAGQFDAVVAAHDDIAYGAVRALTEAGLRVPKDVAVVGFDDQDPSAYFHPALTTVRQPVSEIGMEAGRLLFRRLNDPSFPPTRQRIVLEPTLVIRESSGAPRP